MNTGETPMDTIKYIISKKGTLYGNSRCFHEKDTKKHNN